MPTLPSALIFATSFLCMAAAYTAHTTCALPPHNPSFLCQPYTSRGRVHTRPHFERFGRWHLRNLSFASNPGFCYASDVSHFRALSCLHDQSLVFVGDSVTRFQFIALVHFIHTGQWLPEMKEGDTNHLLFESSWPDWRTYLIASCNYLHPFQTCDVFRYVPGIHEYHWSINMTDNRYYHNPAFNINISFISAVMAVEGHFPMAWRPGPPMSVETYRHREFDYQGDYVDLARILREHVGPVDALFLNEGIFPMGDLDRDSEAAQRVFKKYLAPGLLKSRPPIWMTTTPLVGDGDADIVELAREAAASGWAIMDRYAIVTSACRALVHTQRELNATQMLKAQERAYFDQAHVKPFLNRAFGEAVLGMLCPA